MDCSEVLVLKSQRQTFEKLDVIGVFDTYQVSGKAAYSMRQGRVEYRLPGHIHLIADFFRDAHRAGLELIQSEEIIPSGSEKSEKTVRLRSVLLYFQFRRARHLRFRF